MPHRTPSRHSAAAAIALAALVQAQEATAQPVEERTFYNGLECTPWPLYDIHDTERLRRLGRTEQGYVNAEGFAWWRNTPGSLFCPITRRTTASDQFDVSDIQSVLYYTGDLGGPADDYEARLCLTPYDPNQGSRCGAVNKPGLLGTRPNTYGLGIAAPPKTILGTYFAITAYLNVRRPVESNDVRTVGRLHHYWSYSLRDAGPRRTALRLEAPPLDDLVTVTEGEIDVDLSLMNEFAGQASEADAEALETILSQSTGMEARAEEFHALLSRQGEMMEIDLAGAGLETSCGEVFCTASFDPELDQSVPLRLGLEQPCEFWAVPGRDAQHLVTACE